MSNSFWSESDDFRDIPDEVNQENAPPALLPPRATNLAGRVVPQEAPKEISVQSLVEEVSNEEEDDFTEVLSDASLRLEQGTLYKMIMNHNLFDGMDADPRAVKNVEREIKRFARERMEIMLGMRQEKAKESVVSSPFNDLEVTILKKLASAASKGATEKSDANEQAATVKKTALTPIGGTTKSTKVPLAPAKTPLPAAKAPLARKAAAPAPEQDDEYKPLEKPPSEMTPDELLQRNKEASDRQAKNKSVKNVQSVPQPSPEQEEYFHMTRAAADAPAISAIVSALNNRKN